MGKFFFTHDGKIIDIEKYPGYSKTKYLNYSECGSFDRRIPTLFEKKEDCCGCYACYSICPCHAIEMIEDLEGFIYPVVDLEKCISCFKCEKVCPIKNAIDKRKEK